MESRPTVMRSPTQYVTKATLKARFGPEAIVSRVGAIWLVHLDQPSEAEIQERMDELRQELLEPEGK